MSPWYWLFWAVLTLGNGGLFWMLLGAQRRNCVLLDNCKEHLDAAKRLHADAVALVADRPTGAEVAASLNKAARAASHKGGGLR